MDGLAFLERVAPKRVEPVYVLAGDEDFVKRRVLAALRRQILGEGDDDFGFSTYAGDDTPFSSVHDELCTLPFTGGRRMVVVEGADPFVTEHRSALERYVADPSPYGVLVLVVRTWPATTRLAKALGDRQTIACKTPQPARLPEWCVRWAKSSHDAELEPNAARLLVDLIGPDMGLLDQELAKLAVYVGPGGWIDAGVVDRLVAGSHAQDAFKVLEAVGDGNPGKAVALLERLLDRGEDELRVLGAFSYRLRQLGHAARIAGQGVPVSRAVDQAGVPPFARRTAEQELRHLGTRRAGLLFDWLLETDLGMKGSSSLPPRLLLERLIVRLAQPAAGAD